MAKLKGTALASGLSGSAGTVVFVRGANGATIVRDKPYPNNPNTPKQEAWRDLVRRAGQLWRTLTAEQAEAWYRYAQGLGAEGSGLGTPNASGAFIGLTTKVWQVAPLATPPLLPPAQDFTGDGITVTVGPERGLQSASRHADFSPPEDQQTEVCSPRCGLKPALQDAVTFTASAPNSTGVVTELLLQKLPSAIARPQAGKDRHQAFVHFEVGSLEATVPAKPGAYAASVRFVRAATGQASALVRIGVVVVD